MVSSMAVPITFKLTKLQHIKYIYSYQPYTCAKSYTMCNLKADENCTTVGDYTHTYVFITIIMCELILLLENEYKICHHNGFVGGNTNYLLL